MSKKQIDRLLEIEQNYLMKITEIMERTGSDTQRLRLAEKRANTISRIADLEETKNLPLGKIHTCYGCGQRYLDDENNRINPGERLEARCCPHCGRVRFQSWDMRINCIASTIWGFGRRKWRL